MDIPADASGAGRVVHTRTALLPLAIDGERLPVRCGPPSLGEHGTALLEELGYSAADIGRLQDDGVVARIPPQRAP
jgi:crotonobetainyl-CoA:carnitine CoA-transferase CaiB-like acyl-CoA transferase